MHALAALCPPSHVAEEGRLARRGALLARPGAVSQDLRVQEGLVVPKARVRSYPRRPLGMRGQALRHGALHGLVAALALARDVAGALSRVLHEELLNHLIGADFLGRGAELLDLEGRGARPGVPPALDHDQHDTGIVPTVEVLVEDNVLVQSDPLVELAPVEAGPAVNGHRDGRVPVGRVPDAPVGVDAVARAVDGHDGHRPRRVVGRRVAHAADGRDALHEAGQLGGQARAEAGAARVTNAADAVHVDAELVRHVPQDVSGV
eukprot:CAMPEP_0204515724 /NCGR_PEP_ID=MMETSP0661-20131031/2766_1 /ASSEMBLY_ACC=CAM_ASM_000606 /TAXON_ID=109239 /ORGANISM="Alexandrium margalefi, Strain AMGDE01CS-322" /LENGTH=262 /DNA_ID=CAMNT_0051521053 /DNA_START=34 /DNA_END=818 /DNA_ORIENTATION=+